MSIDKVKLNKWLNIRKTTIVQLNKDLKNKRYYKGIIKIK